MNKMKCKAAILISFDDYLKRKLNDPSLETRTAVADSRNNKKIYVSCGYSVKNSNGLCGIHAKTKKLIEWDTLTPFHYQESKPETPENPLTPETPETPETEVEITRYGYCVSLYDDENDPEKKRWVVEKDTKIIYRIDDEGFGVEKGKLISSPEGTILDDYDHRYQPIIYEDDK